MFAGAPVGATPQFTAPAATCRQAAICDTGLVRAGEFETFWGDNFLTFCRAANAVAREKCNLSRDREAAVYDGLGEAYIGLRAKDDCWWIETQNPLARSVSVVRLHTLVAARTMRRQSREIGAGDSIESSDNEDAIAEYVEREGWAQAFNRCIGRLSSALQDVLLVYIEFGNMRDAGRALDGMDKETFRRRLIRAQSLMRECLERSMNDGQ
jgi:hypothetical protein